MAEQKLGFFAQWAEGIRRVTPLQQLKWVHIGYIISLIGIALGIAYSITIKLWWLGAILLGAGIINLFGCLANWQKIKLLRDAENYYQQNKIQQEGEYIQ